MDKLLSMGGPPSKPTNVELISSYKTHVHELGELVKHLEALSQQAERSESERVKVVDEHKRTRAELAAAVASITKFKCDLDTRKKEIGEARSTIEQLRRDKEKLVSDFEKERTGVQEKQSESTKKIGDLEKGSVELGRQLEQRKQALDDSNQRETKARKDEEKVREEVKKARQEAKEVRQKAEEEVKKVRQETEEEVKKAHQEAKEARQETEEARKEATDARLAVDQADQRRDESSTELMRIQKLHAGSVTAVDHDRVKKDLVKCQADLTACTTHLETFLPPVPAQRKLHIYLHKAIYGGKVLDDPKVLTAIEAAAASGKPFKVTNTSCGGDPWPGTTKSFTAAYLVDGKGAMRYVCAREGNTVVFN